jgi:ribosomal protein L32
MSALKRPPPDECANCGAVIPRHARSCPGCGADERTGWRENDVYDGLELPDQAWDDGNTPPLRQRPPERRVNGVPWYWWCVGIGLLLVFVFWVLRLA